MLRQYEFKRVFQGGGGAEYGQPCAYLVVDTLDEANDYEATPGSLLFVIGGQKKGLYAWTGTSWRKT